jgi:hypothetical protein
MKSALKVFVGLGMTVFLSIPTVRADEKIIAEFGKQVAQAMCADGGAWLEAYKVPRSNCPSISQSVLNPCMAQVLQGRTVPLKSEAELQQVSQNLYTCMKDSFLAKYGANAAQ